MPSSFGLLLSGRNWLFVAVVTITVLFMWHSVAKAHTQTSTGD